VIGEAAPLALHAAVGVLLAGELHAEGRLLAQVLGLGGLEERAHAALLVARARLAAGEPRVGEGEHEHEAREPGDGPDHGRGAPRRRSAAKPSAHATSASGPAATTAPRQRSRARGSTKPKPGGVRVRVASSARSPSKTRFATRFHRNWSPRNSSE